MATVGLLFNYFTNTLSNPNFFPLSTLLTVIQLHLNIFHSFWYFVRSIYLGVIYITVYSPNNFFHQQQY